MTLGKSWTVSVIVAKDTAVFTFLFCSGSRELEGGLKRVDCEDKMRNREF